MASVTIKRLRLGVIVFYLLLFAGLAVYDERPNPDMVAEMSRPLPAFTGPGNAYTALLGFEAPMGKRPYDVGRATLERMEKAFAAHANIDGYLSLFDNSKFSLAFKGEKPAVYGGKDKGILDFISDHPSDAAKLLRENKELLRRYRALFSYREYHEPLDYGFYMPLIRISSVRSTQILYFMKLADKARHGNVAGALSGLQQDMEFWRMTTRSSATLISKLVFLAMVRTDICFAAELGSVGTLSAKETALLGDILRPFDAGETALDAALRGEARYLYKIAELSAQRDAGFIDRLCYKRNATDNRMYAGNREMVWMAGLPPEQFAKKAKMRESEAYGYHRMGIPFLYNPDGEMLALMGRSWGFDRYIEKGHNLEGLRRLALLKIRAHAGHVRLEEMQEYLDAQPMELKDPYTDGPMQWDAKENCIYFKYATGGQRVKMFL